MGPFADETSKSRIHRPRCAGTGHPYTDVQKRGSRLSPERFEVQRIASCTLSIDALHRRPCRQRRRHRRPGRPCRKPNASCHPGRGGLAQQRHRRAPRNLDSDHRRANVIDISETDDQLARGYRWFRSAGPAHPGFGGTLPYSTPKLRQTPIRSASAAGLTGHSRSANRTHRRFSHAVGTKRASAPGFVRSSCTPRGTPAPHSCTYKACRQL